MIFVFSGTGNSYSAARAISEAIGTGMVEIARAVRYGNLSFDAKGEPVGFVFPTYFSGLPVPVREFASNVIVRNAGHVFAVSTCGEYSGGACDQLAELLSPRLRVDAMYDVVMPDNSVIFFDTPTEEEAAVTLGAASEEIGLIASSVLSGEAGDMRRHTGDRDWREDYGHYDEMRSTEPFRITDACIECRICEEVCPDQAIRVYHRKPVWDEPECSLCMSCINLCPKAAIQYGESTESRGRYFNPEYYERSLGMQLRYRRRDPGDVPAPLTAERLS